MSYEIQYELWNIANMCLKINLYLMTWSPFSVRKYVLSAWVQGALLGVSDGAFSRLENDTGGSCDH